VSLSTPSTALITVKWLVTTWRKFGVAKKANFNLPFKPFSLKASYNRTLIFSLEPEQRGKLLISVKMRDFFDTKGKFVVLNKKQNAFKN